MVKGNQCIFNHSITKFEFFEKFNSSIFIYIEGYFALSRSDPRI